MASRHQLPGEFLYKGMPFDGTNTSMKMLELATSLTLTPDDIVLAAYPKSGTAWMKRVIKLVLGNGIECFEGSDWEHFPRLELRQFDKTEEETLDFFKNLPSPRLFGTHFNSQCLESQIKEDRAKVIVVMRNPKDTLVSFYHFYRMASFLGNFTGSWDDFFQLFQEKRLYIGDVLEYNLGFWKLRNEPNVLVVFYEDMHRDCYKVVRDVAILLGKHLTDEVVERIVHKTSFQEMKRDPNLVENKELVKYFDTEKGTYFRKGVVGDWMNHFSTEQAAYINKRCREMCEPEGLTFHDGTDTAMNDN